jgi:hypothetical protein
MFPIIVRAPLRVGSNSFRKLVNLNAIVSTNKNKKKLPLFYRRDVLMVKESRVSRRCVRLSTREIKGGDQPPPPQKKSKFVNV